MDEQVWYRGFDRFGNHYFQSRDDSELLSGAIDVFADGTFKPILGVKNFFQQLYILSVRKELQNGAVMS